MEERRKQDLTAEADGIIEGRNAVIEALRAGETIDKIYLQKGETDKTLGHIASKARAAGVVVVEADRRKLDAMSAEADGIIEGRNAVIEALRAGETIDKIYLQKGETDKTLGHIASKARAAGVVVVEADRRKLDAMSRTHAHQGVIALAAVREYISVESILQAARDKGEAPLLVVCDEISDPHNLGAIIRTAECAGAHGVVIPKRRSAGLTAVVAKTSAGAVAHVPVARVPNIPALLKDLKKQGVWVFGTAADGTTALYDADLNSAEGSEKTGGVGLRHGGGRHHGPVRRGSEGTRRHRHRQRGGRHDPSGRRELRLFGEYPHAGEAEFPECLRRRGDPAV